MIRISLIKEFKLPSTRSILHKHHPSANNKVEKKYGGLFGNDFALNDTSTSTLTPKITAA